MQPSEILNPRKQVIKKFITTRMRLGSTESEHLSFLVDGLLRADIPSISTISSISDRIIHPTTLNRALPYHDPDLIVCDREMLLSIADDRRTGLKEDGYYIIDDTVCVKTGKSMAGADIHRHGSGFSHGYNFVVLFYVDSEKSFPLAIGLYLRKKTVDAGGYSAWEGFQTRNEIATKMLERIPDELTRGRKLLVDAWYCNQQMKEVADRKGMAFVSRAKKNRKIRIGSDEIEITQLHNRIPTEQFRPHPNPKRRSKQKIAAIEAELNGPGTCTVTIIQTVNGDAIDCYPVSTEPTDAESLVSFYDQRWSIETWIRDAKQRLGFGKFMVRDVRKVLGWVRAVLIAYMCLLWAGRIGIFARCVGEKMEGLKALKEAYSRLRDRQMIRKACALRDLGHTEGEILAEIMNDGFFLKQEKWNRRKK